MLKLNNARQKYFYFHKNIFLFNLYLDAVYTLDIFCSSLPLFISTNTSKEKIKLTTLLKFYRSITDFESMWTKLKTTYTNELSILAYSEIPTEQEVSESFKNLIAILQNRN